MSKLYSSPIGITSQFRFCGTAFRLDSYKGCDFGCRYCFINNRHKNDPRMGDRNELIKPADYKKIERMFIAAIDKNQVNTIDKELINKKTPLHLGGNSDPFQNAENTYGITKKFIELSVKYQYPLLFSTKGIIPYMYFELLDPKIHAFQISLFSADQIEIDKFETNTPSVFDRINQIKKLHYLGFWVSVRIQPLIYINSALNLAEKLDEYVDFFTIEHLKLQTSNKEKYNELLEISPYTSDNFKKAGNSAVLKPHIKEKNIRQLKEIITKPIGCGDVELFHLSDTSNCCGIDTMGINFNNWLKYNTMTINKGCADVSFVPKAKYSPFPYIKKTGENYKEWVDFYTQNRYKPFKKEI